MTIDEEIEAIDLIRDALLLNNKSKLSELISKYWISASDIVVIECIDALMEFPDLILLYNIRKKFSKSKNSDISGRLLLLIALSDGEIPKINTDIIFNDSKLRVYYFAACCINNYCLSHIYRICGDIFATEIGTSFSAINLLIRLIKNEHKHIVLNALKLSLEMKIINDDEHKQFEVAISK